VRSTGFTKAVADAQLPCRFTWVWTLVPASVWLEQPAGTAKSSSTAECLPSVATHRCTWPGWSPAHLSASSERAGSHPSALGVVSCLTCACCWSYWVIVCSVS